MQAAWAEGSGGDGTWNGRIVEARTGTQVSFETLKLVLAAEATEARDGGGALNVILGEKHYTPAVQLAQAQVIDGVVDAGGLDGRFTTAWEFLNFADQPKIAQGFKQVIAGELSSMDLLKQLFGRDMEAPYAPIFEATRSHHGELLGVNLTRAEKQPVVKGGIGAAAPGVVPEGFEMGGDAYRERFAEAMGGHSPPEQLANYFAAQCLTDDVIAQHVIRDSRFSVRFLVEGSFHTDYRDGTVARMARRAPEQRRVVIRFVDASDYSPADLLSQFANLIKDPRYGELADYVFFVNEPQ